MDSRMSRRKKENVAPVEGNEMNTLPVPKTAKVRVYKPRTHAEGKPVRGIRPGVRGPNRTQAEINAEKMNPGVIIVPQVASPRPPSNIAQLQPYQNTAGRPADADTKRNRQLSQQLQDMIRLIGNEMIDPGLGWTRIIMVIRRLYMDAASGKTQAAALLFERGWGKVPTPVQMDFRAEVLNIIHDTGISKDEIDQDPVLKMIMGETVEGQYRDILPQPEQRSEPEHSVELSQPGSQD
jgi:hypothetical protein